MPWLRPSDGSRRTEAAHAQIRASYQVNARFGALPVFPDLMGFRRVTPEGTVDWTSQLDVAAHPAAQRAKRIDSRLPAALIALPAGSFGLADVLVPPR